MADSSQQSQGDYRKLPDSHYREPSFLNSIKDWPTGNAGRLQKIVDLWSRRVGWAVDVETWEKDPGNDHHGEFKFKLIKHHPDRQKRWANSIAAQVLYAVINAKTTEDKPIFVVTNVDFSTGTEPAMGDNDDIIDFRCYMAEGLDPNTLPKSWNEHRKHPQHANRDSWKDYKANEWKKYSYWQNDSTNTDNSRTSASKRKWTRNSNEEDSKNTESATASATVVPD